MSPGLLLASSGVFIAVALIVAVTLSLVLAKMSAGQRRLAQVASADNFGLMVEGGPLADGLDPAMSRLSLCSRIRTRCPACGVDSLGRDFFNRRR